MAYTARSIVMINISLAKYRNSHSQVFPKIDAVKNSAKFTGKHQC